MSKKYYRDEAHVAEEPEEDKDDTFFVEDSSAKKQPKRQGKIVAITKSKMLINVNGLGQQLPIDPSKKVGDMVDVD